MASLMRTLVTVAPLLLGGCAAPVGNLVALEGEGVHTGARLVAGLPTAPADRASLAGAGLELAWVRPFVYVRGEASLLPPAPVFAGGSLGAGLHWGDRAAMGGHVVMGRGAGTGMDLSVRPWARHPWVLGASWTPAQRSGDTLDAPPRVALAHDWELSVGWSPAVDTSAGAVAVELGVRKAEAPGGWAAWVRLSGSARFLGKASSVRR